jgi:hypothetical protein
MHEEGRPTAAERAAGEPEPEFLDTSLTSPICEFALPLLASVDGESWDPSGTAIIIGPHLAITARHVIEDFMARYGEVQVGPEVSGRFSLQACQILGEGKRAVFWDITRLWWNGLTDIAVLRLTPRVKESLGYRWRCLKLRLLPPAVGERLHAFGYRESAISVECPDETTTDVTWKDIPTTAHGNVTALHLQGRDRVRLKWPVLETDARFDGGMSGGPVFTDDGRLCGLVCSNMPPSCPGESHVSYVSLLFPLMAVVLDIDRQGCPSGEKYPMLDLAQRRIIHADDHGQVSLVPRGDGNFDVGLRVPRDLVSPP